MSIINNEQDTKEYLQNNTYTKGDIDDKIDIIIWFRNVRSLWRIRMVN